MVRRLLTRTFNAWSFNEAYYEDETRARQVVDDFPRRKQVYVNY